MRLDCEEIWCFKCGVTSINVTVEKYERKSLCQRILEEASGCKRACGEKRSRWPTESQSV